MSIRRWCAIFVAALFFPFLFITLTSAEPTPSADLHCHAAAAHEPSPAEKAYLDGKTDQAEILYREALSKAPHEASLVAGLVRVLLREQKIDDAASTIDSEMKSAPSSATLMTASSEVLYRQGKIVEAAGMADQAWHIDPCNPRLYLVRARILRLNSMYASEHRAINIAHALDPYDIDIRQAWFGTLPISQRIDQQKQFLAGTNGMNAEERGSAERGLADLVNQANSDSCHLASSATTTELALAPILRAGNSRHIESWGLRVLFNNNETTLAVDTGASGLLINRSVAERAGLKPGNRIKIGGIGDQGAQGAYMAHADSIKIGSIEFRNCTVEVTDRKDILSMDGLIGTDVFSNFLVTLDYPLRKFLLSPLPPRPTDNGVAQTGLNTQGADPQANASSSSAETTVPQDRYISPTMKDYSPVFRSGHFLLVPTVLNGKEQRLFVMDTGAFSTAISPEAARAVTKVRGGDAGSVIGMSGAVAKVSFSEAVNFRFGGIQQQNNDLYSFDTSGMSRAAGVEISGFLGSTVLRQLTISIDYRDGLVKFDYDPRHGNHDF